MKSEQTANRQLAAGVSRGTAKPATPDYFQSMQERAVTVTIKRVLQRGTSEIFRVLVKARREIGYSPYNFNPRAPFADMVQS